MKAYTNRLLLGLFLMGLAGCDYFQPREENVLARVHEQYLYESDLQALGLQDLSPEDSTRLSNSFIDNWIRRQLLVQKAQENLSSELLSQTDSKVKDYRNSLLSHKYESQLVAQRLDTLVTDQQIQEYYDGHVEDFQLNEAVVRALYIKTNEEVVQEEDVTNWLLDFPETDNDALLIEYCNYYALSCQLDQEEWVRLSELAETMQFSSSNPISKLRTGRVYSLESQGYKYLCKIIEKKESGTAPLGFVKQPITELLLREREQAFIQKLRLEIYESALNNKEIEIYDKE